MSYDPAYLKVSCVHRKSPLHRNARGGYLWIAALFSFLIALFVLYVYLCIFKLSHTEMSPTFRLTSEALDKVLPFQTFLPRESNTLDAFPCNQLNFFCLSLSLQPLPPPTGPPHAHRTLPVTETTAGHGPTEDREGPRGPRAPCGEGAWSLRDKGEK